MKHHDIVKEYLVKELRECAALLSRLYNDTATTITVEQSETIASVYASLRDVSRGVENEL